ncbi:type IV secretory system conjugative DNA transfer family protein [Vibrio cortegadensis]|uniref:type IV secretory system conjugative DNA transfer family protein n=1 Tax=Vibrio cortegadensis TaxID=1328770 RepID=UPI0021C2E0EA|nr:type IV secretory system conjugative DNA transfer family protein [Vibrio cortegadensis]MDN3697772.1 type IV secretory system conjugative DNA transfer family protein [Vibrio cortegadensis]
MAKKAKQPPLRLPMPINSNPALDAEHCVYIGTTGSGKTTAVKKLGLIPKKSQAVFFDPYQNYAGKKFQGQQVKMFTEFAPFARALVAARSKKTGFKLALVKEANGVNLETFAAIVWSCGDGQKPPLYVGIEELASTVETTGKLKGKSGELWRGGRQFGLIIHSTFQRTQEVPKTVSSQSPTWWVGGLASMADANYIADQKSHDVNELASLKTAKTNQGIAQYLMFCDGIGNVKRGEINCLN